MSFTQSLNESTQWVEHRLKTLCADLAGSPVPGRLHSAITHALLSGGKRFRPFLVFESAGLFGVTREQATETATAIECMHGYSLVHDDLPAMDNDRVRRGGPTVWAKYDEWTAILVGDALQALAFELLAAQKNHPDPMVRTKLVTMLARASGSAGMVGGQALDLAAGKLGNPVKPDARHINKLQAMKTGALIRFSCEAGAILAANMASDEDLASLSVFGEHLGFAFQIADDLLDAQGDAGTLGKAVAKDAKAGKATLVSIIGINEARARLTEAEHKAIAALDRFGPKAETLRHAARFVVNRKK